MKIVIFNVLSSGNKGDLAILESEIQELRKVIPNLEITISAMFPKTFKGIFSRVRVVPSLIDMPTARADLKARNRKTTKYVFYIAIFSLQMCLQCILSLWAALFLKLTSKSFYRRDVITEFANADVLIFNGGEAFKEGSILLPNHIYALQKPIWWIYLFQKFWIISIAAKVFRKPIVVFPNTVGPIRTKIGCYLIKLMVCCVNVFMVRDSISASTLRRIGISNFVQSNDVALLLENHETQNNKVLTHTVGVCPGLFDLDLDQVLKQKYIMAHADVLDYLVEQKNLQVIFLPSNLRNDIKNNDLVISQLIIENMQHKSKTQIIKATNALELQSFIAKLDLLIATRMHPTILAINKGVPFVSIIYDHKQLGLLSELELENCSISVTEISKERLLSKIMFVMSNQHIIKETMLSNAFTIRRKVRRQVAMILTLIQGVVR